MRANVRRALIALVLLVIVAAAVAKLLFFELVSISSTDMAPALQPKDLVLVARYRNVPRRGELVLFKNPRNPNRMLIRRAIALPNDTFAMRKETPIVNGDPASRKTVERVTLKIGHSSVPMDLIEERGTAGDALQVLKDTSRKSHDIPPTTLTEAVYVLSDNRNRGTDSRDFGPVPLANIRGIVTHRISAGPGSITSQPPRSDFVTF